MAQRPFKKPRVSSSNELAAYKSIDPARSRKIQTKLAQQQQDGEPTLLQKLIGTPTGSTPYNGPRFNREERSDLRQRERGASSSAGRGRGGGRGGKFDRRQGNRPEGSNSVRLGKDRSKAFPGVTTNNEGDDEEENAPTSTWTPPPAPKQKSTSLSLAGTQILSAPKFEIQNINKLDLSNCGLKSIEWIKELSSSLTWLSLSGNTELREFSGLETLTGLFVLNMPHCELPMLPRELLSLTSLKALVLNNNNLKTIPASLFVTLQNLNSVILSNNPNLSSLPSTISSLALLNKLSASHCSITPSGLPDLSALGNLRILSLSHNPIDNLPDHFGSWGKGFIPTDSHNQSVKEKRGKGLEVVELSGCLIEGWEGLEGLIGGGDEGRGANGLRSLGLKGNPVASKEDYTTSIQSHFPALQILDSQRIIQRKVIREPPLPTARAALSTEHSKPRTLSDGNDMPLGVRGSASTRDADIEPTHDDEIEEDGSGEIGRLEKSGKTRKRKRNPKGSLPADVAEEKDTAEDVNENGAKKRKRTARGGKKDVEDEETAAKTPATPYITKAAPAPVKAAPKSAIARTSPPPQTALKSKPASGLPSSNTPAAPIGAVPQLDKEDPNRPAISSTQSSVLKVIEIKPSGTAASSSKKNKKGVVTTTKVVDLAEVFGKRKDEKKDDDEEEGWAVGGWD